MSIKAIMGLNQMRLLHLNFCTGCNDQIFVYHPTTPVLWLKRTQQKYLLDGEALSSYAEKGSSYISKQSRLEFQAHRRGQLGVQCIQNSNKTELAQENKLSAGS